MGSTREILKIVGIAGLALVVGQGCSQKSVNVTADSETFEQGSQYADNQAGGSNPWAQGAQPFEAWQGSSGQPSGSSQYGSSSSESSQGFDPEGPTGTSIDGRLAQGGEMTGDAQNQANGGLSYFGTDQYSSGSGPLAGLQEFDGQGGGSWGAGQGYQNGNMAEEFIQEDYDNIAQAQRNGYGQNGQYSDGGYNMNEAQSSQIQVELQDVFFEFNSWRISQGGTNALAHDAEWLAQNQARSLTVEGHCDQRGTRDYNLVLGKKRAQAVQSYLVDLGVDSQKIQVISYGKERPFCFGNDDQCYQLNRRGHLQLHH